MKESVDKQIEEVFALCVAELLCFALRDSGTEDDFAALVSNRIRQDIWHIVLAPKRNIQ